MMPINDPVCATSQYTNLIGGQFECGCYVGLWNGVNPPPMCETHAALFRPLPGSIPWPEPAPTPYDPRMPQVTRSDEPVIGRITITPNTAPPDRLHPDDIEAIAAALARKLRPG